jgi:hypothetical protein
MKREASHPPEARTRVRLQWVPVLVSARLQWVPVLNATSLKGRVNQRQCRGDALSAEMMRYWPVCSGESCACFVFDAKSHPRTPALAYRLSSVSPTYRANLKLKPKDMLAVSSSRM